MTKATNKIVIHGIDDAEIVSRQLSLGVAPREEVEKFKLFISEKLKDDPEFLSICIVRFDPVLYGTSITSKEHNDKNDVVIDVNVLRALAVVMDRAYPEIAKVLRAEAQINFYRVGD
ncbi:MAG: hypothetical protein CMN60_20460 [Sphingobium sp.]|nr:hypothetical protein [Sphingobium sp.]|tara:strand:- start:439 stop:789 length:351 start_codon:yes stop_codon:yes gene_type:complete